MRKHSLFLLITYFLACFVYMFHISHAATEIDVKYKVKTFYNSLPSNSNIEDVQYYNNMLYLLSGTQSKLYSLSNNGTFNTLNVVLSSPAAFNIYNDYFYVSVTGEIIKFPIKNLTPIQNVKTVISSSNLFVISETDFYNLDTTSNTINHYTDASSNAVSSGLSQTTSIFIRNNYTYISQKSTNSLKVIDPSNHETVPVTGISITDVYVTQDDVIFYTDYNNGNIHRRKDGVSKVIAGTGNSGNDAKENVDATDSNLNLPKAIAFDSLTGRIFIAETTMIRVRVLTPYCELDGYSLNVHKSRCVLNVCFGVDSTNPNVCSGRGSCNATDQCSCKSNYFGDKCELTSCNGIPSNNSVQVCSGNGICQDYNYCKCNNSAVGEYCQVSNCFGKLSNQSDVCSGKGICQGVDSCNCTKGFVGSNCEDFTCNGIASMFSSVCSYHGSCIGVDNCQCSDGYYGNFCQLPKCYSIPSNASNVCSGNGNCTVKDTCQCKDGFSDIQCSTFYCNGQLFNSTLVCSQNGNCKAPNLCECKNGYYGMNCEEFTCYGLKVNDSNVCSANGNCTAKDFCKCKFGFSGENCEIPSCSGIPANSSLVCNGNGKCQSLDKCVCNADYSGPECSIPKCFDIAADSNLVCSGIGNCTKPNNCSCPPNRDGYECQFAVLPRKIQSINLPPVIVESISTNLDFKVVGIELRTFSDFLNSRKSCGVNCTLPLTYIWSIRDGVSLFNSPAYVSVGNTKVLSSSTFQLTFSPIISVSHSAIFNSNVSFTLIVESGGESIYITQDILAVSRPVRTKDFVNIIPSSGISLSTQFSMEENSNLWSMTESSKKYLEPLQFAFGFLYNQELIRISEFSINGKDKLYLPYLNDKNTNGQAEDLDIYVICKDALKNEYSSQIGRVSLVPNLVNSTLELRNQAGAISKILPYDYSWKYRDLQEYSSVVVESVNKLNIDINNPSNSLTALKQLTSQNIASTYQVGAVINQKLDSYLILLNQVYKNEKETNGFVSNRLSNSDLKNTLETASNLLSYGYSNVSNLCFQLSTAFLYQKSSTINSIDYSKLSTDLINITISSFVKIDNSNSVSQFSDITLDADYILSKYNGYNKEIGLSLISYNSKLFNSSETQLTNSKDFTLYMSGKAIPLSDLTQPIYISFSVQNLTSVNQSLVNCKFWNETTENWDSQGCSLHDFNPQTGQVTCKCSHTTLFAAFVENSFNNTLIDQVALKEVSNLYIAQISFGVIFLILSTLLMIGLIAMRKSQPLASRFVTPFIGMFALFVECVLLLITQRSILLSAQNGITFSLVGGQLSESTVVQLESADLAANIVSNIITIIVNTLTLTAMFAYLYQISRYHVLKYFYHKLSIKFSNVDAKQSERNLKLIKQILSTKAMITIISTFVVLNLFYWTLWVILVRTLAISGTTYSYIVSISFTVIILLIGFMICGLIGLDIIMTMMNERKEKSIVNGNQQENASQSSNSLQSLQKLDKEATKKIAKTPLLKAYHWFIRIDSPLYFRGEMILFVTCFVFLIISQIIGISGLGYKKGEKMSRVNDSISLLFEILYLFTYLFVFGGYALIVRFVQFIQQKKKKGSSNSEDQQSDLDEMSQLLHSVEGLKLLEDFSEKEYSLENLHLFLEMKHKNQLIKSADNLDEVYSFVDHVWTIYIQSNSIKEVNIPSDCKRKFSTMRNSLSDIAKQNQTESKNQKQIPQDLIIDLQQVFSTLQDQITFNLSDTFSRFTMTDEYSNYLNVAESQQELLSKSKLVV